MENSRTEISVSVGEVPAQPGVQAYLHVVTGDNLAAKARETIQAEIGRAPEDFNLYSAINCSSAESAEELKNLFTKVWTGIISGTATDEASQMIKGILDHDGEGSQLNHEFSVHGTKVIIRATPNEEKLAAAQGTQEFIRSIAGHIFGHDQTVHVELDIGHEIGAILASQNKIIDALNSLRLSFAFHGAASLFTDLQSVAEATGSGRGVLQILGLLSLYQSAILNLRFRTSAELPDAVKERAQQIAGQVNLAELKTQVPPPVFSFLGKLADHTTGDLHVFLTAGRLVGEFKLHSPGLLRVLIA
eukprot:CAMPEP_0202940260 /NCGR_PEP_ID=MMETSP1395-20130829/296_1 /ASSEMBLY_ACC=CAM_ASM_000871 /TAXON_ID=5961 /ORGANISM="Blepharisma japonicum, Strain Stock R1072" /LENGTH=302 /DNA_ID=CAMNT_0049634665 /DNA_START=1 /DNA_END=909 /DNA_ORIENTATION=-